MGDVKVSSGAQVQPTTEVEKPQKAEGAVGKFLKSAKDCLFGKTGAAILAGAASGALLAGLPGAAVGAAVGLGLASANKSLEEGKPGWSLLNAGTAGALAGAAFGLPGLLVGATAVAFATGAAQKAASKVGEFLGLHGDKAPKAEPAPAQ
ncbi:MAG TPA: hypothetical protein V6D23_08850 [Candidatus Obscuribacterales bacterium]